MTTKAEQEFAAAVGQPKLTRDEKLLAMSKTDTIESVMRELAAAEYRVQLFYDVELDIFTAGLSVGEDEEGHATVWGVCSNSNPLAALQEARNRLVKASE